MNRRHLLMGLGGSTAALALPWSLKAATRADIAQDLAIVREALAIHPGALRYHTPASLEAETAAFESDFRSATDQRERFLALSAFLSKLQCGHTHCNFYNQSNAVRESLIDRPTRLPFLFDWIDGNMIVVGPERGPLPIGTRIVAIDGRTPADLLAALLPYARADGSNDGKRVDQMAVPGGEGIAPFDVYQGLIFPPSGNHYAIEAELPDGRTAALRLRAIDQQARNAMAPPAPGREEPLWTFAIDEDGIARLTMPTWVTWRSRWDWKQWLLDRLDEARTARGLVIDVRGNEGGLSCGDPILARLAGGDVALDAFERLVRFRRSPEAMDPYFDTFDEGFRTLGMQGVPVEGGFFGYPPGYPPETIPANGPKLSIPTAVLVGPENSSATFFFAHTIKRLGLGRLFGGTTGGNLRGINGGAMFFVRLPASGLEFDLPLIGYFPKTPKPDAGLAPDVAVTAMRDDIIAGRDPVLEEALASLRG